MTRSRGRHTGRKPTIDVHPGTPEGDAIGLSDRQEGQAAPKGQGQGSPIPGGRSHLGNPVTVVQEVPIAEPRPEFRGVMAHGVPPGTHTAHERAETMRGPNDLKGPAPRYATPAKKPPIPVPVYIVPERGGRRPLKIATTKHLTVPGFAGDPVCLVGKDFNRTKVRILNSDATNNVRIASTPGELVQDPATSGATIRSIGGAILLHGMTGYQVFETQDELWAITQHATATVELDLIVESSVAGAGGSP